MLDKRDYYPLAEGMIAYRPVLMYRARLAVPDRSIFRVGTRLFRRRIAVQRGQPFVRSWMTSPSGRITSSRVRGPGLVISG